MKLRISGNSIRLRLSRGDVERLSRSGVVEESVVFRPGEDGRFFFSLIISPDIGGTEATFNDGHLTVRIPVVTGTAWANSDTVGVESVQPIPGVGELNILIEKDFACKSEKRRGEDSDAFPNPLVDEC